MVRVLGNQVIRLSVIGAILVFVFSSLGFAASELFYETEIIVTATKIPQKLSEQPWNAVVIGSSEIQSSGTENVADLLRAKTGVDITRPGYLEAAASVRLRGASSNQTLVLLDGRRINSPILSSCNLSAISLDNVEKIEVVKTPLSAIYGSDAIGGVVNIITKKAGGDKKIDILLEQGSYSLGNYGLKASGKNYLISANSIYTGGIRANSDYDARNYAANFSWNNFSLDLLKHQSRQGVPGPLTSPSLLARQQDDNNYVSLSYATPNGEFKSRAFVNVLGNAYQDPAWATDDTSTGRTFGLEAVRSFVSNWNNLLCGVELRKDVVDGTQFGAHERTTSGIFVQNQAFLPRGSLFVGAREEFVSDFNARLNPRVGAVFYPTEDSSLKASWAQAFRAPSPSELYWNFMGNSGLKPETGQSIDLSFEKSIKDGSATLSYFFNDIENLIRYDSSTFRMENIDKAEIHGVELGINRRIKENLALFSNYTWQDAQNKTAKKAVNYSPKNKFNVGIEFNHPALLVRLTQNYVGERFADFNNNTKLDGYGKTDLNIVRRMDMFNVKMKAENIFDVGYQETNGYPAPGRVFSVGVEYKS